MVLAVVLKKLFRGGDKELRWAKQQLKNCNLAIAEMMSLIVRQRLFSSVFFGWSDEVNESTITFSNFWVAARRNL